MTMLKKIIRAAGCVTLATFAITSPVAAQVETVRVGWCTSVLTNGAVPFAVAEHFGWFEELGIEIELVNFAGSSDCVRNLATGEVLVAVPTLDPMALMHASGVETKVFYNAYRRNIFGLAVPEDSDITSYEDLRGKSIGVTSMASAGVLVARSVATSAGLNPDSDIRIVVSGQPAQSAILLRDDQIQAVSQWNTQYTLMELAGIPMRMLEDDLISTFQANSLAALPETIEQQGDLLTRVAQAYTLGAIFAIQEPRKTIDIFQQVYPQVTPTGLSAEAALDQGEALMRTVATGWTLNDETENWGESIMPTYQAYIDWLVEAGVISEPIDASELVTNELIEQVNSGLDLTKVEAARAAD